MQGERVLQEEIGAVWGERVCFRERQRECVGDRVFQGERVSVCLPVGRRVGEWVCVGVCGCVCV